MSKRSYSRVQGLLPEIQNMVEQGKTQREIAEEFGLRDKYVVKELLKRTRKKEKKIGAGIALRPQGRPRKNGAPQDVISEQAYEIERLRMENKLLRDFLLLSERM